MSKLSSEEEKECVTLLKKSILLRECTDEQLKALSKRMQKRVYHKGDILVKEGEPQQKMFVVAKGTCVREKNLDGQTHVIDTHLGGATVGSLHVMLKDPAYATSKCVTDVVAYELPSDALLSHFQTHPDFALNIVKSLQLEIRRYTKTMRTPLLEQHPKKTNYFAVSVAASVESFYRSALNSLLNSQLTGKPATNLFPNMHIQLPTRVAYINGFKGLRQYLDDKFNPQQADFGTKLALAVTPGVIMTPMSSVLEACNAHTNPEPLYIRWTRGLIPRACREIIFGVGLNQLSDYCEERVPYFENPALRNAAGSLMAGVVSVHNLSTLKIMNPSKSYMEHFREYVKKSENRFPTTLHPTTRKYAGLIGAFLFPQGVHIRTSQIVGSFIILNGTIAAMTRYLQPSPALHK